MVVALYGRLQILNCALAESACPSTVGNIMAQIIQKSEQDLHCHVLGFGVRVDRRLVHATETAGNVRKHVQVHLKHMLEFQQGLIVSSHDPALSPSATAHGNIKRQLTWLRVFS